MGLFNISEKLGFGVGWFWFWGFGSFEDFLMMGFIWKAEIEKVGIVIYLIFSQFSLVVIF